MFEKKNSKVVTEEMDEMTTAEVDILDETEETPKKESFVKRMVSKIPAPIKKGVKVVTGCAAAAGAIFVAYKMGEGVGELNARREGDFDGDHQPLLEDSISVDLDEFQDAIASDPSFDVTEF